MGFFSVCLFAIVLLLGKGVSGQTEPVIYNFNATTTVQYLASRNYPNDYSSNANEQWRIDAGTSEGRVRLDVIDASIESDRACNQDHLFFYDGLVSSSPQYGGFCGTFSNCYFITSQRHARVNFVVDATGASRGFNISYRRIERTLDKADSTCGATSVFTVGFAIVLGLGFALSPSLLL